MSEILLKLRMLRLYGFSLVRWWREVWQQEAYAQMCCNGYMCGCYGSTYADMWEHLLKQEQPQ